MPQPGKEGRFNMKQGTYVLFNFQTDRAVSYGDFETFTWKRKCYSITAESYRVYDTHAQRDVYCGGK